MSSPGFYLPNCPCNTYSHTLTTTYSQDVPCALVGTILDERGDRVLVVRVRSVLDLLAVHPLRVTRKD